MRPAVRHMLLATFWFALMNVCIKQLSSISDMEVVFVRCFVSMMLCFAYLLPKGIDWKGTNRARLLARGTFGTIAVYTFFITLHEMPLGTAVTIQYLSPIFTTVIAIFLLNEKVKPLQWLFFALSFAGVLLIKGFDARISLTCLGIGIISALASGFAYNMVRSLKEKEHAMVVVLHFQIIGTLVGGAVTVFQFKMPQGIEWLYLILVGVFTQLGQVNLTKSLQAEKMANVTILNYLGIIYALLFGYFIFGERYELLSLSGILLVVGGVLLNLLYTQRSAKAELAEEKTIQPEA